MPRPEANTVRFEKVTTIKMVRVEPYDSSNVNDTRTTRDCVTILAETSHKLPSQFVADEIKKVLSE